VNGAAPKRLKVSVDDVVVDLEAPSAVAGCVRARYAVGTSAAPAATLVVGRDEVQQACAAVRSLC
jgi:hypothetical protein